MLAGEPATPGIRPPHEEDPRAPADGVVATRDVFPPHASIRIRQDPATGRHVYEVVEPVLSDEDGALLVRVRDALLRTLTVDASGSRAPAREHFETEGRRWIARLAPRASEASASAVLYHLMRDNVGYGRIDALMRDAGIEDISCDGPGIPVFVVDRLLGAMRTNVVFGSDRELDAFVMRLAQISGRNITLARPLLDATLPDGNRLQATLAREVTTRGSSFTIRKFRTDPFTPTDLVGLGTISAHLAAYLWLTVEAGGSLLFIGGTASGKTSTLNATAAFIPPDRKVISLEDTREINLPHENWIAGITRVGFGSDLAANITMYRLLEAALRQRPDHLIVGEVRGAEAITLFQAMATGHATYSTLHADSARGAVHRLGNQPINVPRQMLTALGAIVVQASVRVRNEFVRRVTEVVEILELSSEGDVLTNTAFRWDPAADRHVYLGRSQVLDRIGRRRGMSMQEVEAELEQRAEVLAWAARKGLRSLPEIVRLVTRYETDPKGLAAAARKDEGLPIG